MIFRIASKTELRKLNLALYARLYRKDRIWLNEHSPEPAQKKTRNIRVDWNQRDLEVLAKVQHAVSRILESDGKPKRLTVGRIRAIAGVRSLLEKHLDRLPETKQQALCPFFSPCTFCHRRNIIDPVAPKRK